MSRESLKIALLVKALPCHQPGGLEFHALDLARGLNNRGHRVTLITSTATPQSALEADTSGLRIEFAQAGPPGRYSRAYFNETQRLLAEWHAREKFDLVHAQEFSALYLKPPADLPLVSTIHGTLYSETPLAPAIFKRGTVFEKLRWSWQFKHRLLLQRRYLQLLRKNRRIIVDSEFSFNELKSEGIDPKKIHLAPLGIDESRFHPVSRETAREQLGIERPFIFSIARLTWSKGVHIGIDAFKRTDLPVDYRIVGSGPEKENLRRLARSDDRIVFHHEIPQPHVPLFYAGAELVLMPEITQPAFGLVALEANLMATAVLAARTGALPEVLGEEGGWLFERGDVNGCASQLQAILKDPEQLYQQGEKARQSALKRFSLNRMAESVENAYMKTLG